MSAGIANALMKSDCAIVAQRTVFSQGALGVAHMRLNPIHAASGTPAEPDDRLLRTLRGTR